MSAVRTESVADFLARGGAVVRLAPARARGAVSTRAVSVGTRRVGPERFLTPAGYSRSPIVGLGNSVGNYNGVKYRLN